jgi:hypothetical protein
MYKEVFFFAKKNQKTFAIEGARCGNTRTKQIKVFWFFFTKKNILPYL